MSHRGIRTRRARGALTAGVALAAAAGLLTAAPAAQAVSGEPAATGDHAFTARLVIGEGDTMRGCSAALVHQQWLLTATSCFASTPGAAVKPGKPALKSTATLGGKTLEIVEVVPRDDRDVAMARLAEPVTTVQPVKLAADAPVAGETLLGAGFGRTRTEWVPNQPHTGEFRVDSATATTVALTGQDGVSVCKGDTGGPALRGTDSGVELTAVHSRSWQGGCFGQAETETRTGAVDARADGLAGWVTDVRNRDRSHSADIDGDGKADLVVLRSNGDIVVHRNQGDSFAPGRVMSGGWGRFVTWKDLGRLYFADVNGDRKADMIVHTNDGNIEVRTNHGTYWDQGTHWSGGWGRFIDGSDMGRLYFEDVNGDRKADLIVHTSDGNIAVRTNRGTYWDSGTHWSTGWGRFVTWKDMGRLYFEDVNGDGKADLIVHTSDGNIAVRTNHGTYWDSGTHWSTGWGRFIDGSDMGTLMFGDATGDGKADLFVHTKDGEVAVRTNHGNYWDSGKVMITL
ncbi:FG-GAP-like repeat-containing protein [Streptomyces sp. M92]|uniref:FG-GAP-like repeat-containing protein n=1 Tax=Streptomyces sp. M92 TaxID=2944250 RepID=UPI002349FAE2|nr:FG-GAP-like repeat-containing protein [Streptomyces sp. M92]WCN01450.1 FG-GAP-like repeat-containing protein [Streptomyces sp. M92]